MSGETKSALAGGLYVLIVGILGGARKLAPKLGVSVTSEIYINGGDWP